MNPKPDRASALKAVFDRLNRKPAVPKLAATLAEALAILVVAYHAFAFAVWQGRNPKANAATFFTHYLDVVCWRELAVFQEHPDYQEDEPWP